MDVIELKQIYRNNLDILNDPKSSRQLKEDTFEHLKTVYEKIKKLDPKTTIDTPEVIRARTLDEEQPDVVWGTIAEKDIKYADEEIESLERIRLLAYRWVRKNHPNLDDQTDKFGQIVNARMQIIIAYRR